MFTVLLLFAILSVAVVAGVLVVSRRAGDREERADVDVVEPDADDVARPGEPTRLRADGRPPVGSREDRRRHGRR